MRALLLLFACPAWAEVPSVVADIPPVHSLVATVMEGAGTPALLLPAGASVHDAALRPSDAWALEGADVVVWTGPALLPAVADAVAALAPDARVLALLEAPGWEPLPARADLSHDGHEHESMDPHAWLDPAVAAAWMGAVAEALADADPANAALYRANAARGAAEVMALGEEVRARLAPFAGRGYAVGHDAFQYWERATGLPAAWAVAPADGGEPSPGDVAALRAAVEAGEVSCVLSDAEAGPDWAETLIEGTQARTAVADPEGLALEPGAALYPALIRGLADALEGCLS